MGDSESAYVKKHYRYIVSQSNALYCKLCGVQVKARVDTPYDLYSDVCTSRSHMVFDQYSQHILYLKSKGIRPRLSNSKKSISYYMDRWHYIAVDELDTKTPKQLYMIIINRH